MPIMTELSTLVLAEPCARGHHPTEQCYEDKFDCCHLRASPLAPSRYLQGCVLYFPSVGGNFMTCSQRYMQIFFSPFFFLHMTWRMPGMQNQSDTNKYEPCFELIIKFTVIVTASRILVSQCFTVMRAVCDTLASTSQFVTQ